MTRWILAMTIAAAVGVCQTPAVKEQVKEKEKERPAPARQVEQAPRTATPAPARQEQARPAAPRQTEQRQVEQRQPEQRQREQMRERPAVERRERPAAERTERPAQRTERPAAERTERPGQRTERPNMDRTERPGVDRTDRPTAPRQERMEGTATRERTTREPAPGATRRQQPVFRAPQGTVETRRAGGASGTTYTHQDGRRWDVTDRGQVTKYSRPGVEARYREDGRVRSVRDDGRGLVVERNPRGGREVVLTRPGGVRVVSVAGNRGYVERPARSGYVQRTYIVNSRPTVVVYRTQVYRSVAYQRYMPSYYYGPGFYFWAGSMWGVPVRYSWGWGSDPWYGHYGGYWRPAPEYSSPSMWLTDYLIGENLRLSYELQQERRRDAMTGEIAVEARENETQGTLTPALRMAIAEEVRKQLEEDDAAARKGDAEPMSSEAPPPALDPKHKVFVVSMNLEVRESSGGTCALTPGDVIIRTDDRVDAEKTVGATVLSSKPGNCGAQTEVAVKVVDLQEMYNQFRLQVGTGLEKLSQGKDGLPSSPAPQIVERRVGQLLTDSEADAKLIREAQAEADEAEREARSALRVERQ